MKVEFDAKTHKQKLLKMLHPASVVLITTDFPPDWGGLQSYSYQIAEGLKAGKLKKVEAAWPKTGQPPRPRDKEVQYGFHHGRSRLGALPWSLFATLRHGWGGETTLLHMQWTTALGSYLLKKMFPRFRYIILAHGAELLDPNRPILNWIKKAILRNATWVITGSQAIAEIVQDQKVSQARIRVVPYGYTFSVSPDLKNGNKTQALMGEKIRMACLHRLVPRKGTSLLLEALANLGPSQSNWTLDIAGEGPEKSKLQAQALSLGLSHQVHFVPPLADAEKFRYLQEHQLFILPSLPPSGNNDVEGLGIGLLEAQAAGLAVLAARTGGIPEAIHEGYTGLLFQAGDIKDLQSKLKGLLEKPESLRQLGQAGPQWIAENFSWEKSLSSLAQILN